MGSCLSAHRGGVIRCQLNAQDPLESLDEREITINPRMDSTLREVSLIYPRSKREPWRSFLDRDYWNKIVDKEKDLKSSSECTRNLCSLAKGDFCNLSAERPKVFSIFVSSTFTDTEVERNLLIEDVQPYLRELCTLFGYEFRFCEMRWGVREEASEDHQTVKLCMEELNRCQKESCGINFITFLCDKYGYCPFPASIPEGEFEELLSYVDEEKCRSLLVMWFKKDENMVKPEYILQKISSIIVEYNDDNHEKRKKARDQWWSEFETMQKALKSASSKLKNIDRRKYYEISVTELEVLRGLLETEFPEKTAFVIRRCIKEMEGVYEEEGAGKFIDIDWSSKRVNQESRDRLLTLKNEKVPKVLRNQNIKDFDIEWSVNGIKRDSHQRYLQEVTDAICHEVFDSIKEHFMQESVLLHMESNTRYRLEKELRQGADLMKKLCESAVSRDNLFQDVHHYISSESSNNFDLLSPLVINGKSGSGKSTIMALSIMEAISEFRIYDDSNIIFRFIGTTRESGDTRHLLSSLLHQLHVINGATNLPDENNWDIELLAKRFKYELREENRRTVIFLDALDQLSDVDSITEIEWLPTSLPPNVRLIISCTPSRSNTPSVYFQYLKSIVNARNFISVAQLSTETCEKILSQWLEKDKRILSHIQMEILKNTCRKCPLPLFLKIAYDETKAWHSYDDVSSEPLKSAMCIEDLILQLYERLAIVHGQLLFERGLAYLTAAKDGLSRQELEDILSCDDDVLNDIFQWWVPPIRRIPQLQVVRLLSDLKDYLTETDRFSNGVPLLRWFHRQFRETTTVMVEQTTDVKEIHKHMANYFGGIWAVNGKAYKDRRENNKELIADRKIPSNPLLLHGKLTKSEGEVEQDLSFVGESDCKINLRRLNEHCYHLIKGGMLEDAANLLSSLKYIHSKMRENKMTSLLEEFSLLLDRLQEYESSSTLRKVEEFSSFVLQRGHVMAMYPSLTYQEAANYVIGSSVRDSYTCMEEKPAFILRNAVQNNSQYLVSVLKGHRDSVISACFQRSFQLNRSSLLATGSLDGKVKLWFYHSGLEKGNFNGHSKGVNFIDFVDNSLLTISSDGRMVLWDAEHFEEQLVFSASCDSDIIVSGNCCRLVNDMNWIVSAWDDGIIRIGNMKGNWVLYSEVRQHPVTCVRMVSSSKLIAGYANGEVLSYEIVSSSLCEDSAKFGLSHNFGINDELIEVFDILIYNSIYVIIGKQKSIRTQYTEDSNSPWAKNRFKDDPYVQNLVDEGMELTEAIGKKMERDMSSVGCFVMLRTKDGTYTKHVLEGLPTPHEYVCGDLKFPCLITGGSDGSVRVWRIDQSGVHLSVSLVKELGSHSLEVNRVHFISNGCQVVSVSDDTDIKLWNTESTTDDSNYYKISQTNYHIMGCISEGNLVVTWGKRGLVSVWREEELLWTKICCSGEDITSAGISSHGAKIMVGAQNYYELLDSETGSTFDVKRSCVGRRVRICDFSEDGREVLLGDNCDIRVVVVEPQMEPLGFNDIIWKAHDDCVNSAQFCTQLFYIASGSLDGNIKMWNSSQDCCLVINIGFPVLSFMYFSSFNKLACILEGGDVFNLEVSNKEYLCDELMRLGIVQKSDDMPIGDAINNSRLVVQDSCKQISEQSKPMEENIQFQSSNKILETWCLPKVQDDLKVDGNFPLPIRNEVQPSLLWDDVELPPMSEEMLKNLENLQGMFMNDHDATEFIPPPLPSHQIGPHRLLKKQRRLVKYEERKDSEPTKTTKTAIALLDLNINEPKESKIVFKGAKSGLNNCILTKDCKTLYSSSSSGEVFVWRNLNGRWYDIARYVNENDAFVSEVAEQKNQILVASKNTVQKLCIVKN